MSNNSIAKYFPFCRVKVVNQTVTQDAGMAYIEIEPDERYKPVCHICGGITTTIHNWETRDIRDLNFASAQTWLKYKYRKIFCRKCQKVVVEELDICQPYARVTNRLAKTIYELCETMSVTDVAKHYSLDWKTVKNIDKHYLEKEYEQTKYEDLRIIAVDEIAIKKGHNYMTVVLNYETGEVVWLGKERKAETLNRFYDGMTAEQKENIEAVAIDMWDPFIKSTKKCLPNAKIVFDLYHVVSSFGRVIDKVRNTEYQKASEADKEVFKGSKYLLLKNKKNIRKKEHKEKLKKLLKINKTLSTLMILKDKLKHLWDYTYPGKANKTLAEWITMSYQIKNKDVQKFSKMLLKHFFGIVSHCEYKIHTSKLEGVNNKIKVIKRKAYGFHDERYFALKVIQGFAFDFN